MEEEEYDPYLAAFDNIKIGDKLLYENNILKEDEMMINEEENKNKDNEDIEMKNDNNLEVAKNDLINENENNIPNNEINIINNENYENVNPLNNKNKENNNLIDITLPKKLHSSENEINKVYEYGYTILYLKDEEDGTMEDFLNEKSNESTTEDIFNYHMDEKKWIKFLNHSIFVHYKKNLREEELKEKQRKQFMFINAQNINLNINNPTGNLMAQNMNLNMNNPTGNLMGPLMVNYYQNANLSNLKNGH